MRSGWSRAVAVVAAVSVAAVAVYVLERERRAATEERDAARLELARQAHRSMVECVEQAAVDYANQQVEWQRALAEDTEGQNKRMWNHCAEQCADAQRPGRCFLSCRDDPFTYLDTADDDAPFRKWPAAELDLKTRCKLSAEL